MFNKKINAIFYYLQCSNIEISSYGGGNPSLISRIRNNKRNVLKTSKSLKILIIGIYSYALNNNSLNIIKELCQTKSNNIDSIVDEIITWLFNNDEIITPSFFPLNKKITTKKEKALNNTLCFGEKLNNLMNILNISNIRLAKHLNIDSSHISRFRHGLRSPSSNKSLQDNIISFLYQATIDNNKVNIVSKLLNINDDTFLSNDGLLMLSSFLFNNQLTTNKNTLLNLLEYVDTMKISSHPQIEFPKELEINDSINDYYGDDGLRKAVIRFLSNASKRNNELLLFSDQDMNWLTSDKDFLKIWSLLMFECVKNNCHIKIIHNINRDIEEMFTAIKEWLPLYMSGLIESYIFKKRNEDKFSHTIFVNKNNECIFATNMKGQKNNKWYSYITDKNKIAIIENEYSYLLSECQSLITVTLKPNNFQPLYESNTPIYSLLSSFSLCTMPFDLLNKILKRNNIDDNEKQKIIEFYQIERKNFFQTLEKTNIYEIISLNSNMLHKLNCSPFLYINDIFYTDDEYHEHIIELNNIMNKYQKYHLIYVDLTSFKGIQIILSSDKAYVIKSEKPYAIFHFSDQIMYKSFQEFLVNLINTSNTI